MALISEKQLEAWATFTAYKDSPAPSEVNAMASELLAIRRTNAGLDRALDEAANELSAWGTETISAVKARLLRVADREPIPNP